MKRKSPVWSNKFGCFVTKSDRLAYSARIDALHSTVQTLVSHPGDQGLDTEILGLIAAMAQLRTAARKKVA